IGVHPLQSAANGFMHLRYYELVAALLEVRDLTVKFPSPRGAFLTAVRDLSCTIGQGEVLGLVGESGSGKSVTSLALMGLLPLQVAVSGQILFTQNNDTSDLLRMSDEQLRQRRGSAIGMIFQEPMTALNPVMRVG